MKAESGIWFSIKGIKIIPTGNKNIITRYRSKTGQWRRAIRKSKEAENFINILSMDLAALKFKYRKECDFPIPGRIVLRINYIFGNNHYLEYCESDLDNLCKGVFDAIEKAGIIVNDKNVVELGTSKDFRPSKKKNKIEIMVMKL